MASPNMLPNPESAPTDLSAEDRILLHGLIKRFVDHGSELFQDSEDVGLQRHVPDEYLEAQGLDYSVLVSDVRANASQPALRGLVAMRRVPGVIQMKDGPPVDVEVNEIKTVTLTDVAVGDIAFGIMVESESEGSFEVGDEGFISVKRPEMTVPEIQAIMRALQTTV